LRIALPIVATLSIIGPLAWLWQDSRVPSAYSVMNMGYPEYGVGAMPDLGVSGPGGLRLKISGCRRDPASGSGSG
jgi:hypothetical protein